MKIDFQTRLLAVLAASLLGCGVDRLQHVSMPDGGVADAAVEFVDNTEPDAGAFDAGRGDAGALDAGPGDAGAFDAGPLDAGAVDAGFDAGSTEQDAGSTDSADAGFDAGMACTNVGISPQLAALSGGPYQNCQGGTIPRTDIQTGTEPWSGCCGDLVRVCQVTGYSTMNAIYCR